MSSDARAIVALAAALAALLFLLLPGTVYLANIEEFGTPGHLLAVPGALAVLVAAIAATLAARRAPARDLSRVRAVLAALTMLVWAQAYLGMADYGPLDGTPIDWTSYGWRGWIDAGLWMALLGLALWRPRMLAQPLSTAAFVVVALQTALLGSQAVAQREAMAAHAERSAATRSLEAMSRFSSERNVLHIVLDSFQADVFKDIVEGPTRDFFLPALEGFTFYEENIGTFPATYFALPAMFGAQVYRNHMPRPRFIEETFSRRSVLNAAHAAGFEVDLAAGPLMLGMTMRGAYTHAWQTYRRTLTEDAAYLLDLAAFRAAPHALRRWIHRDQRWLLQSLAGSELLRLSYLTDNAFLARVTRDLAVDRNAPVYKYFHFMSTHAPFVARADCSYAGGILPREREPVTWQSQCSLSFVTALLQAMQRAGIYDESLIVIMADHGGHLPPHRFTDGPIDADDGSVHQLTGPFVGLATPLLAIKPPRARGPMRISRALVTSLDLPATLDATMGLGAGLPGRSILDPRGPADGPRFFHGYPWRKTDARSDYIGPIHEYRIEGSVYDAASWSVARTFEPPGERQ